MPKSELNAFSNVYFFFTFDIRNHTADWENLKAGLSDDVNGDEFCNKTSAPKT